MNAFEYANPTRVADAVGLLGTKWGEAEALAGGTDLLSLMKDYVVTPKRLVNLKAIGELRGIEQSAEGIRIGALVTLEELIDHEHLGHWFPSLVQAAEGVAGAQIRAMGTVGGDLCQRPRCWYFRGGQGLLARGADGKSLIPAGDNRYHAILGNAGPAYFVHPSSLAPALVALGASIKIAGSGGERSVPAGEFFKIPKSDTDRETALEPNEIVTHVVVPADETANATYEVRQREALDWPLATASVALKLSGGKVESARVVLGHVAPVPWRAAAAEKALVGKTISEQTAAEAGKAAVAGAKPLSKNGYKVQLASVATKRALLRAAGKLPKGV